MHEVRSQPAPPLMAVERSCFNVRNNLLQSRGMLRGNRLLRPICVIIAFAGARRSACVACLCSRMYTRWRNSSSSELLVGTNPRTAGSGGGREGSARRDSV